MNAPSMNTDREMQTTVLHAKGLVKRFGGITATDHVTLALK